MSSAIDSTSGGASRIISGETLSASMQAMAKAAGANVGIDEIMQLYAESASSAAPRDPAGATRPGVPAISPPSFSADDAALMIGELQSKMNDLMAQQQTGEIKSNQIEMKQKNLQQMEKIQKWLDDLSAAAAKRKSAGIWGWIKSALSAVASVVAAVLAVAASPFTGGASILVAVIAIGAAIQSVSSLVIQGLKEAGVKVPALVEDLFNHLTSIGGIISGICRLAGVDQDKAAWVQMGIDLVVGLATGVGAWRAASKAAEATGKLIKLSVGAQKAAAGFDATQNVASFALGVGQGVLTIQAGKAEQEAAYAMADRMEIMARISKLQAVMEQNVEDLKKIVDEMQSVFKIIGDLVRSEAEMKSQVNALIGGRAAV
jgi:hypothetical protein